MPGTESGLLDGKDPAGLPPQAAALQPVTADRLHLLRAGQEMIDCFEETVGILTDLEQAARKQGP
jgi:hypothetical protein